MNEMTDEIAKKIVDKANGNLIKEMSKLFTFWHKSYRSSALEGNMNFAMGNLPEIKKKKVEDLTDEDFIILFIDKFINADEIYSNDPIALDKDDVTEVKQACSYLKLMSDTFKEKISRFNTDDTDSIVHLLKIKQFGDLTIPELLLLLVNTEWDKYI